jgi:PhnB protein
MEKLNMSTNLPEGYNTINPFIITQNAIEFTTFLKNVFGANERSESHTMDTDGLLLHAELEIGNSVVMVADRKEGWPLTPGLLQIYVDNLEETLRRADEQGARVVTRPTDVYGDLFSRFLDPWDNLWWVYQHKEDFNWEQAPGAEDATWATESSELNYIHETLLETMPQLGRE